MTSDRTFADASPPAAMAPHRPTIAIVGKPHGFAGHAHGFRQPTLMLVLEISGLDNERMTVLRQLASVELSNAEATPPLAGPAAVAASCLLWLAVLHERAGVPLLDPARMWPTPGGAASQVTIVQPCLTPKASLLAFEGLLQWLNQSMADPAPSESTWQASLQRQCASITLGLSGTAPKGFNMLHFLKAAADLGVPWSRLNGPVFQFGWGRRARWLSSSFTDRTPGLSVQLARDKLQTGAVLRASGLPVAAHGLAETEAQALAIAQQLGYPVVVKPVDLDGGTGVTANLQSPAAVRRAHASAKALSKRLMVEKHFDGRDYRIQVVQGEIHGVLERLPGGITGNGVDAVRVLLERQNTERRTATDDRRFLKSMALDDEALELLAAQGLSGDAVAPVDQFVRLRGAANVASGGVPVPVDLARVHPDNRTLALRAASALRLDVAGVDLLISDIERSWLEVGAAICEVNAQPQMFSTMHAPMLARLLDGGDGRIPTVVVLGGQSAVAIGARIHQFLNDQGHICGLATDHATWIGGQCVCRGTLSAHAAGTILIRDPTVGAMVLCVGDEQALNQGWPVDRCDVLVLAGADASEATAPQSRAALVGLIRFAADLRPQTIVVDAGMVESLSVASMAFAASIPTVQVGLPDHTEAERREALVEAVMRGLGL